jgi:hypothetical protein
VFLEVSLFEDGSYQYVSKEKSDLSAATTVLTCHEYVKSSTCRDI